jgi:exodeoxyribonuclease VII large subunit
VRALAAARHPTVAAIGHEADAPLVDFVADARAATPSTAAQTVLPRRADLLRTIEGQRAQATRAIRRTIARLGAELARIGTRTPLASTEKFLGTRRQRLDLDANAGCGGAPIGWACSSAVSMRARRKRVWPPSAGGSGS